MSSDTPNVFTKDNLDTYLKALAKEFRKLNGKGIPAEIILIGGAAVLANYGFRDMTTDVDAVIHASSSMKDAINHVGDTYDLPNGWLNADFMQTNSYSAHLDEHSVYYKTFSNVLQVRTVSAEYLIAMKLRSGRKYKNDLSDVIGILAAHETIGTPITMESIHAAVNALYGDWNSLPLDSQSFIEHAVQQGNYAALYQSICSEEQNSKEILVHFEQDYPGVTQESNVNDILSCLKQRKPPIER